MPVGQQLRRSPFRSIHGIYLVVHHPRCTKHHQHYWIPIGTRICYFGAFAVEVVEGVTRQTYVSETTTMIVIGIILSFISLAFLCWLLFALLCG